MERLHAPRNGYRTAFRIVLITGLILVFAFTSPLLGAISAFELSSAFGCRLSAVGPADCTVLGIDLGARLYGYALPFFGTIATPLAFWAGFSDVFVAWVIVCLALWFLARKSKARQEAGSS